MNEDNRNQPPARCSRIRAELTAFAYGELDGAEHDEVRAHLDSCAPCRTEGELLEEVIDHYHSNPDVAFLAVNTDHDRSGVEDFLREEGWTIPIAYASGIDSFLNVRVIPTLMIFDRNRRMTFRQEGFSAVGFIAILERKIEEALKGQSSRD